MSRGGKLALVLHAHLPFVRHPEHPRHLEEHWLFEAITDSYLPVLRVLFDAARRNTRFRITCSLSPTLLSMLADPLMGARYLDYLGRLLALCDREVSRHPPKSPRGRLAGYYQARLLNLRDFYTEGLGGNLIAAWGNLRDLGLVELMTTAATHGYLPLLRSHPAAVRAQLRVAHSAFESLTRQKPDGLWLPECGYYPELEQEVASAGFSYTVLDAHGLQQGRPAPRFGVYAPVSVHGFSFYGRDPFSAREVWDRETGFPGHPLYREYHNDLGFDGDPDILADFLPRGVESAPTGIKYFRVTGRAGSKEFYDPNEARQQAARDARRFLTSRLRLLARLSDRARMPIVVAPYDAELFGHWWYEGPTFLDALIRQVDREPDLQTITLGGYLRRYGSAGHCRPAASSWGERGYNETWLRPDTGWVFLHLHDAAVELGELIRGYGSDRGGGLARRLLLQAARSLLLAQSSDWTFHMGRGGGGAYAEAQLRAHLARFGFLAGALRRGEDPGRKLVALERMDNLFPDLNLHDFL